MIRCHGVEDKSQDEDVTPLIFISCNLPKIVLTSLLQRSGVPPPLSHQVEYRLRLSWGSAHSIKKINTASQKQLKFKGMGLVVPFLFLASSSWTSTASGETHATRGAETLIKVSFVRVWIGGCCWIPLHWGARIRCGRRGVEDPGQDCAL